MTKGLGIFVGFTSGFGDSDLGWASSLVRVLGSSLHFLCFFCACLRSFLSLPCYQHSLGWV